MVLVIVAVNLNERTITTKKLSQNALRHAQSERRGGEASRRINGHYFDGKRATLAVFNVQVAATQGS